MAGLYVIATASKRNHELVKSQGADFVVDYRDEDWIDQVKKVADPWGGLHHVFDTISMYETTKACVQTFPEEGGHIVCIMARTAEELDLPTNVKLNVALCYTVFGEDLGSKNVELYESFQDTDGARPQDQQTWKNYVKTMPQWLETKALKPNPLRVQDGLDDIMEGLELQQKGLVSGQKVVYNID